MDPLKIKNRLTKILKDKISEIEKYHTEAEEKEKRAQKRAEQKRKRDFQKKWVSSTPEQQAEIIFELIQKIDRTQQIAARADYHHIVFG